MSKLYYPEEIIGSKFEKNKCYYLVKWKKFKDPTWEPEEHIIHRTDLIYSYRDMMMIQHMSLQNGGYIYCRVSSKEQSKYSKGHTSLEVQERAIREYCEENDINVIRCIHETYSARNMDRMRGLRHLCDIAAPGQTIFVYDISRFSRNAHHALNLLEELCEKKIGVYSVTENVNYGNPAAKNHFRLQLCASTYFSDLLSQKVTASIRHRRVRGDHIGGTAFGYTTEVEEKTQVRKKVRNPDEVKIIEEIWHRRKDPPAEILVYLKENKVSFRNREPSISGIKRIISRFDDDLVDIKCGGKVQKCTHAKRKRKAMRKKMY